MTDEVHHAGEFYAWLEQRSSIHAKAVSGHGDPIELTSEEAREAARVLLLLADQLDRLDDRPDQD